jgi:hypothetical protein
MTTSFCLNELEIEFLANAMSYAIASLDFTHCPVEDEPDQQLRVSAAFQFLLRCAAKTTGAKVANEIQSKLMAVANKGPNTLVIDDAAFDKRIKEVSSVEELNMIEKLKRRAQADSKLN